MELHHLTKIKKKKKQHITAGWLYSIYTVESIFYGKLASIFYFFFALVLRLLWLKPQKRFSIRKSDFSHTIAQEWFVNFIYLILKL